jgi:hypothetical protein
VLAALSFKHPRQSYGKRDGKCRQQCFKRVRAGYLSTQITNAVF